MNTLRIDIIILYYNFEQSYSVKWFLVIDIIGNGTNMRKCCTISFKIRGRKYYKTMIKELEIRKSTIPR